jgi:DNA-binding Xre family transcriptional regulator
MPDQRRAAIAVVDSDTVPSVSDALRACFSRTRVLRQQRHLGLREAAAQIGITHADLSRFENGLLDVRLSTLLKIIDWMENDPYA